jgi:hypothetical protein
VSDVVARLWRRARRGRFSHFQFFVFFIRQNNWRPRILTAISFQLADALTFVLRAPSLNNISEQKKKNSFWQKDIGFCGLVCVRWKQNNKKKKQDKKQLFFFSFFVGICSRNRNKSESPSFCTNKPFSSHFCYSSFAPLRLFELYRLMCL